MKGEIILRLKKHNAALKLGTVVTINLKKLERNFNLNGKEYKVKFDNDSICGIGSYMIKYAIELANEYNFNVFDIHASASSGVNTVDQESLEEFYKKQDYKNLIVNIH